MLPEEMIPRNRVIDKIRRVYEKYGFVPIDTPILEHLTTLIGTGGETMNKDLFRLKSPEGESVAMRFDLTVPFSRVVAQYPERIRLPFRRYHVGPVFRADKPGLGRFRQFTQFDIDAAGSDSVVVDAEIVAAMCESLRSLGLWSPAAEPSSSPGYRVRVSNRKLMDALLQGCGIADKEVQKHVLRVVDKLQKVGLENVRRELGEGRVDDSGDPIEGVGLRAGTIAKILEFVSLQAPSRRAVMDLVATLLPPSPTTDAAVEEMGVIGSALDALGLAESEVVFDLSLTRGLDYYTGPVFEAFLPAAAELGSVMGGGRFDNLVGRFLDTKIPATGASIGLDRLMAGLSALGKIETCAATATVIVLSMADVPVTELLTAATELRNANVPTEVYMGAPGTAMRDQLSYANAKGIPIAVIIGPDEVRSGKASVKDLGAGRDTRAGIQNRDEYRKAGKAGQVTVDRRELVKAISTILERLGTDESRC